MIEFLSSSHNVINRVRNLLAKFLEFFVYKVIASHPCKPKMRNMSPKFSKIAKGGPELSHQISGLPLNSLDQSPFHPQYLDTLIFPGSSLATLTFTFPGTPKEALQGELDG